MSFDPKNIVVNTSYTDRTMDIIEDVNAELNSNNDLLVGDVIHATNATIVGSRDRVHDVDATMQDGTIVGDVYTASASTVTGGADTFTLAGMVGSVAASGSGGEDTPAVLIGDVASAHNSVIRAGHDSFAIGKDASGVSITNSNLIIGDVQSLLFSSLVAGNDTIVIEGDVTIGNKIHGNVIAVNKIYGDVGGYYYNSSGEMQNGPIHSTITGGNDVITVKGTLGESSRIYAGWGNDKITVHEMDRLAYSPYIYGESGNDSIYIGSMDKKGNAQGGLLDGYVYGGDGSDVLVLSQMNDGEVYGDAGNDRITISGTMSGGKLYGGNDNDVLVLSQISGGEVFGEAGSERITVSGTMSGGTLDGGASNDTINVHVMNGGSVLAGDGNDSIIIKTKLTNGAELKGDSGKDIIDIHTVDAGTVAGGFDNDKIDITTLINNSSILGEEGDDSIKITTMTGGTVNADTSDLFNNAHGKDSIKITTLQNAAKVYGGASNDTINISTVDGESVVSGDFTTFHPNDGDDSIKITTVKNASIIYGATGDDTIHIDTVDEDSKVYGDSSAPSDYDGDDSIKITTVKNNSEIYGRAGSDSIYISTADKSKVYGGIGNDSIKITSVKNNSEIYGEYGDDTIDISTVDKSKIYGDVTPAGVPIGNDNIKITSVKNNSEIYGEKGDDSIKITTVKTSSTIYGGQGDDTIDIGTVDVGSVDAGSGDDRIIIGTLKNGSTILGGEGDDYLKISKKDASINDSTLATNLGAVGEGLDTLEVGWAFNGVFNDNTLITTGLGEDAKITLSGGRLEFYEVMKQGLFLTGAKSAVDIDTGSESNIDTYLASLMGESHTLSVNWDFDGTFNFNNNALVSKGLGANAVLNFSKLSDAFISTAALVGSKDDKIYLVTDGWGSGAYEGGSDTITLASASHVYILTGADHDVITIHGTMTNTEVNAGVDSDFISIGSMGAGSKLTYNNDGVDSIRIKGTFNDVDPTDKVTTLSTGDDGGSIELGAWGTGALEFGDGDDTLIIHQAVSGTAKAPKEINMGDDVGRDMLIIHKAVSDTNISMGDGRDTLTLSSFSYGNIDAGNLSDLITIDTLKYAHINLAGGTDTIDIKTMIGSTLEYGNGGPDHIYIGGTFNHGMVVDAYGNAKALTTGPSDGGVLKIETWGTGQLEFGAGPDGLTIKKAFTGAYGSRDIDTLRGMDTINLFGTVNGATIHAGADEDIITVLSLGTSGAVDGGDDEDIIQIGKAYDNSFTGRHVAITLSKGQLAGGAGNDIITIGNSYDTSEGIVVVGNMKGGYVDGGAGDDSIATTNMSGGVIYAGEGVDTVDITNVSGGIIHGSAGNDSISITTLSNGMLSGGDGVDTLNITNMNGGMVDGGDGTDHVTISTLTKGTVNGAAGVDAINIGTMKGGTLFSVDTDAITITNMSGGSIRTDATALNVKINENLEGRASIVGAGGNDTIVVSTMRGGNIDASEGADSLNISTMRDGSINTENGNDIFDIEYMYGGSITTEDGSDSIDITYMHGGSITTEDGNDSIDMLHMYGGNITTGDGVDTIEIGNVYGGSIHAGNGDDYIWINSLHGTANAGEGHNSIELLSTNMSGRLLAGGGDDTLTINTFLRMSSKASIDLGLGDNLIMINGIENAVKEGNITLSSRVDTVQLNAYMTQTKLNGGAGNDVIEQNAGSNSSGTFVPFYVDESVIDGNTGNDSIHLMEVKNKSIILGGVGNDSITIESLSDSLVDGDTGHNVIDIKGDMNKGIITTGSGNDIITITSSVENASMISTGTGSDLIDLSNTQNVITAHDIQINYNNAGLDTIKLSNYAQGMVVNNFGEDTYTAGTGAKAVTKDFALSTGSDGGTIELGTWESGGITFGNGHDSFVLKGELKNHNAEGGAHELAFMAGNDSIEIHGDILEGASITYDNRGRDSIALKTYSGDEISNTYGSNSALSTGTDGGSISLGLWTEGSIFFGNGHDAFELISGNIIKDIKLGTGNDTVSINGFDGNAKLYYNATGFDSITIKGIYDGTNVYQSINGDGEGIGLLTTGTDGGFIHVNSFADAASATADKISFSDKNDHFSITTMNVDATIDLKKGTDSITIGSLNNGIITYNSDGFDSITITGEYTGSGIEGYIIKNGVPEPSGLTTGADGGFIKIGSITTTAGMNGLDFGDGKNSLNIGTFTLTDGDGTLTLGRGNDTVNIGTLGGLHGVGGVLPTLSLDMGDGSNTATITTIENGATLNGGAGADNITISDSVFGDIYAENGNNKLHIGHLHGTIYTGAGVDNITVATASGAIHAGLGNDIFNITTANKGIIYGEYHTFSATSHYTAGADKFTFGSLTNGASIYGDVHSISYGANESNQFTVRGGNDVITVEGDITGSSGNEVTIVGDMGQVNGAKTVIAGNDNITLKGDVTYATIYTDNEDNFAAVNDPKGGNDILTLGIKGQEGQTSVTNTVINLGIGNDVLTAYSSLGDGTQIHGHEGSNKFTLSHINDTTVTEDERTVAGGKDNDIFTIHNIVSGAVDGGEGDDAFTITDMSGGTVYGGNGVDKFTIKNISGGDVDGGDGNDTFNITNTEEVSGLGSTVKGGDGNDVFTIDKKAFGTVSGDGGNDKFIVTTMTSGRIDGNAGTDTINVTTMFGGTITGGSAAITANNKGEAVHGADSITVKNITSATIHGDESSASTAGGVSYADLIKITGTSHNGTINGGEGNDTISVVNLKDGSIVTGGHGGDKITITTSTDSSIYGDDAALSDAITGNDTIFISNAIGSNIYGGSGEDSITINAAKSTNLNLDTPITNIDGGKDDDFIKVTTLTDKSTLTGGEGSNDITVVTATGGAQIIIEGTDDINITTLSGADIIANTSVSAVGSINIGTMTSTVINGRVEESTITLDSGADTLTIGKMLDGTIDMASGDDSVSITTMSNASLNGGDDNDMLKIVTMNSGTVDGGAGNDSLTITTMNNGTINGDAGTDTFDISNMKGGSINGGADVDTFNVTLTGTSNGKLFGDEGADVFNITAKKGGSITIGDVSANDGYVINITGKSGEETNVTDAVLDAYNAGDNSYGFDGVTIYFGG